MDTILRVHDSSLAAETSIGLLFCEDSAQLDAATKERLAFASLYKQATALVQRLEQYPQAVLKARIWTRQKSQRRSVDSTEVFKALEQAQQHTIEQAQRHTLEQQHTIEQAQRHTIEQAQQHTIEQAQQHTIDTIEQAQRHTIEQQQRLAANSEAEAAAKAKADHAAKARVEAEAAAMAKVEAEAAAKAEVEAEAAAKAEAEAAAKAEAEAAVQVSESLLRSRLDLQLSGLTRACLQTQLGKQALVTAIEAAAKSHNAAPMHHLTDLVCDAFERAPVVPQWLLAGANQLFTQVMPTK